MKLNKSTPKTTVLNVGGQAPTSSKLVRKGPSPMALEQRFMFDGAAVGDAIKTLSPADTDGGLLHFSAGAENTSAALNAAQQQAEALVAEFLQRPDAAVQMFAMFNGGQVAPSAAWQAAAEQLVTGVKEGSVSVHVELRSSAELQGAKGAFSSTGTTGQATIYLNSGWLAGNPSAGIGGADSASINTVLVEELGHYIDSVLNAGADTAGDEGEIFSRFVIDGTNPLSVSYLADQNDHITLQIEGQDVQAELASFNFVNAYAMVYDLNNSGAIVGSTGETAAEKEQSTHNFDITALGTASVNDGTGNTNFSGNDVSAIGINIGGQLYYGWISRPIKSGGIVRGFYFWTDPQFTDLATAQADGNMDGDSNATDNKGFLLVVDQAWFNQQIAAKQTTVNLSNVCDGMNRGNVTYSTVGSSSDRVDSALNSLIVNDLVKISDVTVNEGSPYAVFTVSGLANQAVTLELGNPNGINLYTDLNAHQGTIQYFNGTNWVNYTSGSVNLNNGGTLLVRVNITSEQETALDGLETFNLVAKNSSGVAGIGGTGTVVDDGTGSYFDTTNNTATSALPTGFRLDDDRPLTVNSITVNEGSPYGVFTVSGASGQTVLLSLTGASGSGSPDAAGGPADLGTNPALQYFEAGTWKTYDPTNPPKIAGTATTLLVRVAINAEQETALDGPETFNLLATNTGGTASTGQATIKDDGTGSYWLNNNTTAATPTELSNAGIKLDDDRPITITSPFVNEASPLTFFTITGAANQLVSLNLAAGSATATLDFQTKVEYFNGTNWVLYTGGTVPLNDSGSLLVRVPINNDAISEGNETFTLTASNTGGGAVIGTATIQDDSNGKVYNNDGTEDTTAIKDDDRLLTVDNVTVNEAAGPAEFTVTGVAGQLVKLQLQSTGSGSGDATISGADADVDATLTYFNGTSWVTYDPSANGGYVAIPNGGTTLQVRVAITRDALVESNKTFFLTATNTGGSTARGTGTITDYAPPAAALTAIAVEAGGANNAAAGFNPSNIDADPATNAQALNLVSGTLTLHTLTNPATGSVIATWDAANSKWSNNDTESNSIGGITYASKLAGTYGTIYFNNTTGAWTYLVDNSNTAVQALRLSTNTLTETFTYTVKDTADAKSSNTLAITIRGANDAPVASTDYNEAKESLAGSTGFTTPVIAYSTANDTTYDRVGYKAQGNVLPNDTDVDSGDTKTISGLVATGSASGTTNTGVTGGNSTTLSFTTLPSNVSKGYYVWLADQDGVPDTNSTGSTLLTSGGAGKYVTVLSVDLTAKTFTLSGAVDQVIGADTILGFSNNAAGAAYKEASISGASSISTSTVDITGFTGQIGVGMTVTGGGLSTSPAVTVLEVNYDANGKPTSVVISTVPSPSLVSAALTFSGTAAAGSTLSGTYGTLVLNADGSYTYTPYANNSALSEGQSANDVFNYTMHDAEGLSSSSTLTITVLGSGVNDADAKSDTNYVVENSGTTSTGNGLTSSAHNYSPDTYADVGDSVGGGVGAFYLIGAKNTSSSTEQNIYATTKAVGTFAIGASSLIVDSTTGIVAGMVLKSGANELGVVASISGNTITLTSATSAAVNNNDYILFVKPAATDIFINGQYGVLTIHSNGAYSYALTDNNPAVNALTTGQKLTDTFNYRISNGYFSATGDLLTDVAALTITIYGTNDAPVLDLDPSNSGSANFANTFTEGGNAVSLLNQTGVNLSDVDSTSFDNLILSFTQSEFPDGSAEQLRVNGATVGDTIILGGLGNGTTTGTLTLGGVIYDFTRVVGSGTVTFTFTKDVGAEMSTAETEALLDALRYENTSDNPTGGSARVFTLKVTDGAGLASVGVTSTITVVPVNDAPTLDLDGNNTTTTGADYAGSFRVGGDAAAIAYTDVAIADVDSVNLTSATITLTNAKIGDSFSFNGTLPSNIVIAGLNTAANTDGTLVVTLATKSGSTATKAEYEAAIEAIRFAATGTDYTNRVFNVTVYDDSVVIGADGVPTLTAARRASNTAIATLQVLPDDRALTVTGTTVNEASPFVLFTVGGVAGQRVSLELAATGTGSGHAVIGADTADANPSTRRVLQYLDGTTWTDYVPGSTVALAGTTLLVRTAVFNDTLYEGDETLRLIARNDAGVANDTTSGKPDGKSHIKDDGTGDYFASDNKTATPAVPTGVVLDDDRPLTVTDVTVNEGSPWAVFTVTGVNGQTVLLSLANASGSGTPDAVGGPADLGNSPAIQYLDGSTWKTYDPATPPTINSGTTLLARVAIGNESDAVYDGPETFNLLATNTGGTAGTGNGTIVDNGTGEIFKFTDATGNTSAPPGTPDDDRPITITSPTVNEASPFAVFTVVGEAGQKVSLSLGETGTATKDTDYVNQIEYSIDGGRTWTTYATGYVSLDGPEGSILVRVPIKNDDILEHSETFTLTARNTGNTPAVGTATVVDEGNGTIYKADGSIDNLTAKDDDRPITVIGGNYNENSGSAVFTVKANPGQLLAFDVRDVADADKAPTGDNEGKPNDSLDKAPIYYSLDGGATWRLYTGAPVVAGNVPVLVAVDVSNERDDIYEGEERFQLVVNPGPRESVGYASLFDDGTGTLTNPINESTKNYAGADNGERKDDDRPVPQSPPPAALPPAPAPEPAAPAAEVPLTSLPPFNSATVMQVQNPAPALEVGTFPVEAILTSDSGFPVKVAEPGNPTLPPNLTLANVVTDQFAELGQVSNFAIPYDTFAHTKADAQITLIAKQQDGSELPNWVTFDPQSGTFKVTPPADLPANQRELKLMVIARDQEGREAMAPFRFFVGNEKGKVTGRLSLMEQIKLAGKRPVAPWGDLTRQPVEAKVLARTPVVERAVARVG